MKIIISIHMLSDAIRTWNPWWAQGRVPAQYLGIEREKLDHTIRSMSTGLIKAIIGPRRAGTTTLMYQVIQYLIDSGVDPNNILFLNFDDNNVYNTDLDLILNECRRITPGISHIFLDEVQAKQGWDRWIRTMYDTKQFQQIFVSGSSSSLMKEDISDVLAGRHLTIHILPFSFGEFVNYVSDDLFTEGNIDQNKAKILNLLDRYLERGGYPEAVDLEEPFKTAYLSELFDDMVARDVVARHGADYSIAKRLAYYLHSNTSKVQTIRSISRSLDISPDTVSKYIRYLESAYLVHSLDRFSYKVKQQMRPMKKYYSLDQGLAAAVSFRFSDDRGRILENVVLLELLRRTVDRSDSRIFFFRADSDRETDFLVMEKERPTELIQVCWDPTDPRTMKRELDSISEAMRFFKIKRGSVITENKEGSEKVDGGEVIFIPIWKWILEKQGLSQV